MAEARTEADTVNTDVDDMEFASARRDLAGWQGHLWRACAGAFVLWHLWILLVQPVDPTISRAVHVFFGAAMGFALFAPRASGAPGTRVPWYDLVLIVPALLIPLHYILDADGIEMRSFMGPNTTDLVVAGVGILLVLEFARRTAGIVMPLIAITFIAYCFVGPWLPGILWHRGVAFDQVLVERLHAQFARFFHDFLDLMHLALADQVGNQRRVEQHLHRRRSALAFLQRDEALRDDGFQIQ